MKQQVNLYQNRLSARPRLLSGRQVFWIGGLGAVLFGLVFGMEQLRAADQARTLDALREKETRAADRVVRIAETHPPAQASATRSRSCCGCSRASHWGIQKGFPLTWPRWRGVGWTGSGSPRSASRETGERSGSWGAPSNRASYPCFSSS